MPSATTGDEDVAHTLLAQPASKQRLFNIAVIEIGAVAKVVVAKPFPEQRDDAGLCAFFDLADSAHDFSDSADPILSHTAVLNHSGIRSVFMVSNLPSLTSASQILEWPELSKI